MMELQEIKKQLPHGAIKRIAQKVGITQSLASLIVNGRTKSSLAAEVYTEAAKIISEHKAKEKEAKEVLQKALSE